jgi:hypothetical protein
MPTTPQYGWDTPADTDYVTNGALSIRTLGDDIDATVYSIQTTLDAEKLDVAGGTLTGFIVVPTNTAAGKAIGITADGSNQGILQFLNAAANVENGYLRITSNSLLELVIGSNGNKLTFDNTGNTTRTHSGEARPIPFAIEAGRTTVSGNSSSTVTLNSGRFTRVPLILITPERNTAAAGVDFHSGDRTTADFKIFNNASTSWVFNWQAIQMTATDSEG